MSEASLTATEIACIIRILADQQPDPEEVDLIYLFHQTEQNAPSSILAARELYQQLRFLNGNEHFQLAVAGWESSVCGSGFDAWRQWLGLPTIAIPPVDLVNANSLTESRALAKAAKERGWANIIVIAPPFHLPRSFITLISQLQSPVRVYAHPGRVLGWNTPSIHSQGVQSGTWMDFAAAEVAKIKQYHEKGDLMSLTEVIEYLDKRDGSSP